MTPCRPAGGYKHLSSIDPTELQNLEQYNADLEGRDSLKHCNQHTQAKLREVNRVNPDVGINSATKMSENNAKRYYTGCI